jgi:hypothetical protein
MLQLVGFGSSSSHSNLQAEFACAAAEDSSSGEHEAAPAAAAEDKEEEAAAAAAAKPARGGRGSRKAAAGATSKSKHSGSKAAAAAATEPEQQQVQEMPGSAWLAEVLQLLPSCVQQPLLLKEACGMLSSRLQGWGAVHSAAALLQLSLGERENGLLPSLHACISSACVDEHLAASWFGVWTSSSCVVACMYAVASMC